MKKRFLLVMTVKDDDLNIWEWVAYHKMIGFDDIIVFQNRSRDGTERTLKLLEKLGYIKFFPNNFSKHHATPPYQARAYRRASRLPEYSHADWCITLDADEFFVVNTPQKTLQSVVDACPDVDAIRINWRVFGYSYLRTLDERLQTERFTWAAASMKVHASMLPVKTLFRPASYSRMGVHLPKDCLKPDPKVVTGSGIDLDRVRSAMFLNSDVYEYKLAQINHYQVRDSESFLIKSSRGSVSKHDRVVRLDYWHSGNFNAEQDFKAQALLPQLRAYMAEMDAAAQGQLSQFRREAYATWKSMIAKLKEDPEYKDLYDKLIW